MEEQASGLRVRDPLWDGRQDVQDAPLSGREALANDRHESKGRVDYVSIKCTLDYDQVPQVLAVLERTNASDIDDQGARMVRVKCWGASKERPGRRIYTFDTWGRDADDLARALPLGLRDWVVRLDWREELPGFDDGAPNRIMARYQLLGKRKGLNVTTYNSRARNKAIGRDGGGIGIAIGSHKSSQRVSMYKRGKESGAVEIQMQDDAARNIILEAEAMHPASALEFYNCCVYLLEERLAIKLEQVGFTDRTDLWATVTALPTAEGGDIVDARLADVKAMLDTMTYTDGVELLRKLGLLL